MRNAERCRVQRRPLEHDGVGVRRTAPEVADVQRPRVAIARVDGQRVADGREVDADLVRAAGLRNAGTQRIIPEPLAWRDDGERSQPRLVSLRRHPHSAAARAGQRKIDPPRTRHVAPYQREVGLFRPPRFEDRVEGAVRLAAEREDHRAAGVAIEPVDRHRPRRFLAHLGDQRLGGIAPARHGENARRLVRHHDLLVPVEDAHHSSTLAGPAFITCIVFLEQEL